MLLAKNEYQDESSLRPLPRKVAGTEGMYHLPRVGITTRELNN